MKNSRLVVRGGPIFGPVKKLDQTVRNLAFDPIHINASGPKAGFEQIQVM